METDDLRPLGRGRLVLRALAILSALGFLTLVMLQAMAFYEPPKPVPKTVRYDMGYPTKAAPVSYPSEPTSRTYDLGVGTKSAPVVPPRMYLPATKAGVLGPLKVSEPPPAPPRQAAPRPRD